MRPLEQKFPGLYYDIVHVKQPGPMGEVKEQRTAKTVPPTAADVVRLVLELNGAPITPAVASQVAHAVREFLGPEPEAEAEPEAQPEDEAEEEEKSRPRKKTAKD